MDDSHKTNLKFFCCFVQPHLADEHMSCKKTKTVVVRIIVNVIKLIESKHETFNTHLAKHPG